MSLNNLGKGKYPRKLRHQDPIRRELVDVTQRTLHCGFVLSDAQLRLAGEVAQAMYKELNVLLERCTRREWRLIPAL